MATTSPASELAFEIQRLFACLRYRNQSEEDRRIYIEVTIEGLMPLPFAAVKEAVSLLCLGEVQRLHKTMVPTTAELIDFVRERRDHWLGQAKHLEWIMSLPEARPVKD